MIAAVLEENARLRQENKELKMTLEAVKGELARMAATEISWLKQGGPKQPLLKGSKAKTKEGSSATGRTKSNQKPLFEGLS